MLLVAAASAIDFRNLVLFVATSSTGIVQVAFLAVVAIMTHLVVTAANHQEAAQRLQDQLHESQKMEAVGKLAAGLAHDFNNLLMVIEGHLFMHKEKAPSPAVDEHVTRVRGAVERATSVIAQLMAFSRQQHLEATVLNLNAVIDDVVQMVAPSMRDNIELVMRLDARLAPVMADSGQLGQVLVNLALNARDAMPDGGHRYGYGNGQRHGLPLL